MHNSNSSSDNRTNDEANRAANAGSGYPAQGATESPAHDATEYRGTDPQSLKTQLVRFVSVGVFTAIIDFGLTLLLTHFGLHRSAAKAIGWVFGTIAAYLINARWTFNSEVSGKTAAAVGALYVSTFAVQNGLYWLTDAPLLALGLEGAAKDTVSFVIAQGVATVTNFFIQRLFIFKGK